MHKKKYFSNQIDYYYSIISSLERRIDRIPVNTNLRTDKAREDFRIRLQDEIVFIELKVKKLAREWKKEETIRKQRQEEQQKKLENRKPPAMAYNYTPPEQQRYLQYTQAATMRPYQGGRCSPR